MKRLTSRERENLADKFVLLDFISIGLASIFGIPAAVIEKSAVLWILTIICMVAGIVFPILVLWAYHKPRM